MKGNLFVFFNNLLLFIYLFIYFPLKLFNYEDVNL